METLTAIQHRRSVKQYDPEARLSPTEVAILFEAARLAPTSFNIQHNRFVHVTDPALRAQLRAVAMDQAQLTEASELIVICADVQAWQKQPERYWRETEPAKRDYIVSLLGDFYRGREWLQRDEAIRSGALAAQTLMLAAQELGYDSCPMIGFDFDKVAELIRLPADHVIVMMVAIGKAKAPAWPRSGQLAFDEMVIRDRFPA